MKPTTLSWLQKCKQEQKRFATITAYDYSFARLFAEEGINVMLVGDSLGMTVQGHDSTLPVTVADIAYHTQSVRRGAPNCLLLADLPFMAYATPEQAFANAATVMRAGANMVKIEGGRWLAETITMLTERAVPVCGHLVRGGWRAAAGSGVRAGRAGEAYYRGADYSGDWHRRGQRHRRPDPGNARCVWHHRRPYS